jgi:hypothetical protein
MADQDSQLPVRALASEFTASLSNSAFTTINPAEDYSQGSTTSGQNGVLIQGAVTTSAPTYTTGQTSPLSLDASGNLRVSSTFTPSGTQNVNVLQWDTTSLGVPTAYGTAPTTGNYIGVNAYITNTPTVTANAGTGTFNIAGTVTANQGTANATPWNENIAQYGGTSTSLGQKASSASIPVVIASDQSVINVQFSGVTPVLTYFTDAAVASGATVTHSLAGPVVLDKIDYAMSGSIKMTVAIGVTGSEVTYWNGFVGVPDSTGTFELPHAYTIPNGSSVKVTLKNRDTSALDTYLTFFSH